MSYSASIKSRSSEFLFFSPNLFFFPSSDPLSHFQNHNPGRNPKGRDPVLGIGVPDNLSIYIDCTALILSCAHSAKLNCTNRNGIPNLPNSPPSTLLQKRSRIEKQCVHNACLFKTIESFRRKRYRTKI